MENQEDLGQDVEKLRQHRMRQTRNPIKLNSKKGTNTALRHHVKAKEMRIQTHDSKKDKDENDKVEPDMQSELKPK